jgi:hypothetical protein
VAARATLEVLVMALSERQRLRTALVVAAVLHGALAWLALRAPRPAGVAPFRDPGADDLLWLERSEPGAPPLAAGPQAPEVAADADATASSSGRTSGRHVAIFDRAPRSNVIEEQPGEGLEESEPIAAGQVEAGPGEPSRDGPSLTLDQLGIGKNPFVAELANTPHERPRRSSQGLRRSIAESIVKRDQRVGLGAEGPILKQLEAEIRRSRTTPNSKARFRASIDRKGNLVGFELLDATSDYRPWRELAAQLLKSLRGTELRVPKTGRGLSLEIAIDSRVQLPSGADPGLAVDILGIPVKKGEGERSHKISILSIDPGGREMRIRGPGGQLIHLPEPPKVVIFGLAFDPVDIGAPAQRVVRSHVESVTSEDIPDAEPEPSDAGPKAPAAAAPAGVTGAAK